MGFKTGAFAKVWDIKPKTDAVTNLRISISRKDKNTGEWVTDFSGFVDCLGKNAAQKALALHEGDKIQLGDCDVSNTYVKEKNTTYYNCKLFDFKSPDEIPDGNSVPVESAPEIMNVEEGDPNEGLPF